MYEHSAYEMSQLGTFEHLTIWLYGSEGPVPHFHFINEEKGIEGCIRLDKPEYFSHGNKCDTLSSRQRKELIKFLSTQMDDVVAGTYWQAVLFLWNTNNPKYAMSKTSQMPDYSKLQ